MTPHILPMLNTKNTTAPNRSSMAARTTIRSEHKSTSVKGMVVKQDKMITVQRPKHHLCASLEGRSAPNTELFALRLQAPASTIWAFLILEPLLMLVLAAKPKNQSCSATNKSHDSGNNWAFLSPSDRMDRGEVTDRLTSTLHRKPGSQAPLLVFTPLLLVEKNR